MLRKTAAEQFAMLRKKLSEAESSDGIPNENTIKVKLKEIKEIYSNNIKQFEKILEIFYKEMNSNKCSIIHSPNSNPYPDNFGWITVACTSPGYNDPFMMFLLDDQIFCMSKFLNDQPNGRNRISIDKALGDHKLEPAVKMCFDVIDKFHAKLLADS